MSFLLILSLLFSLSAPRPTSAVPAAPPLDREEAQAILDASALESPEGIWRFPDDNVDVCILRERQPDANISLPRYVMTVVESGDARMLPGDTIGFLEASVDPTEFRMRLVNRPDPSALLSLRSPNATVMSAKLDSDGERMEVKASTWRLKLNPMVLFSRFWRIVKLQHDDPTRNLPAGLTRLYPSYDGNGSSRRQPRYL